MIEAFKLINYINAINDENLTENIFIHYFDLSLSEFDPNQTESENNNIISESNDNNDEFYINSFINSGKNVIKLMIVLFLSYEELNEKINRPIKAISDEKYFLINEEFMRKYKEYYNYHKIINSILNDDNIKSYFLQNKKQIMSLLKNKKNYELYLSPIIEQFNNDFILELGEKRENQDNILKNLKDDKDVRYS